MIVVLSLSLVPWAVPAPANAAAPSLALAQDAGLDGKIAAAGKDVAKLLELAASLAGGPMQGSAERVYKRVIEIDADNEVARKALRHQLYDGKWFESFAELSKFKREEAAKMKAKGLARWKDEWLPEGDVPFLQMGWEKDTLGAWTDPVEVARAKQVEEWKAAGHQFRADDNSWIAPEDFDKWRELQWKCGDAWVDTAKANEFHSKIEAAWELTGDHFEIWATCDWEVANLARWHAEKARPDLLRLFGIEPKSKPHVFVVRNLDQYNKAASDGTLGESEGFSSLHGAYFADEFLDGSKPQRYLGCGVSYWDSKDPKLAVWGPYWLRFAAAQSYIEAIDPSWTTVAERIAAGNTGDPASFAASFWGEKKIPRWLRYGAAAYVERFLKDPEAAEGADPWTLRSFAFSELKKAKGIRKLDDVFAFGLSLNDLPGSSRLYYEAGLVVSFLLDGAVGNKEITAAHDAFKAALKTGTKADVATAAVALQKSLAKSEREIKKYAGL